MFRQLRRRGQQISGEEARQILERGKTGVLGVIGDGGYPYTVPVNYVYADGKIYLHCAKTGHKTDAIKQCNKVSFCVIDRDDIVPEKLTTCFRSVILFGKARILETGDEIRRAAKTLGLKYYNKPDAVENEIQKHWNALCCIEIVPEHISGKEGIEISKARKN